LLIEGILNLLYLLSIWGMLFQSLGASHNLCFSFGAQTVTDFNSNPI